MGSLSGGPDMITGRRVPTACDRARDSMAFDNFRIAMKFNSMEEMIAAFSAVAELQNRTTEAVFNEAYEKYWRGEQE